MISIAYRNWEDTTDKAPHAVHTFYYGTLEVCDSESWTVTWTLSTGDQRLLWTWKLFS